MKITLKDIQEKQDDEGIACVKALLEEHNPFTFLTLHECDAMSIKHWLHKQYKANRTHPDTHMFWICYEGRYIGIATIKKQLQEALYAESGHIGLCILAPYRRRGYGKQALCALIEDVKKRYGIQDILLCCHYDNVGSRILCEHVGGVKKHENSFIHYWISDHIDQVCDI